MTVFEKRVTILLVAWLGIATWSIAVWAGALLVQAIAPERQAHAVDRLQQRPWLSFLLGAAPWLLISAGFVALLVLRWPGPMPVLLVLSVLTTVGVAVTGRAVGERLMPDATPVQQTMLGAMPLCLPGLLPVGIVVLFAAASLGLGGWLQEIRSARAVPPPTEGAS